MFWLSKKLVQTKSMLKKNKLVPIIEGENSLERISNHIKMKGYKKIVILTSKNVLKTNAFVDFAKKLEKDGLVFSIFDQINKEPDIDLAQKARVFTSAEKPDVIVAVGPAGVIEIGKIVSVSNKDPQKRLMQNFNVVNIGSKTPLIAAPNITGGSVVNCDFSYIMDNQKNKICLKNKNMLPELVVLDVLLSQNINQKTIQSSAFECLAKALESYFSSINKNNNEYSRMAIKMIFDNLQKAGQEEDFMSMSKLLKASYLTSVALNFSGAGYALEIANQIDSKYNVNMAQSLGLVLLPVIEKQKIHTTKRLEELADYLMISKQGQTSQEKAQGFIMRLKAFMNKIQIKPQIALESMHFKAIVENSIKNVNKNHAPAGQISLSGLYDILEELREI